MFKGFYTLSSGMLTDNRIQNVVGNNLSNMLTPGYKKDTLITSTFQEEMGYRMGNLGKSRKQELGPVSMIRTQVESATNFKQGAIEETGMQTDFAINGNGFFEIETDDGLMYTRNGSFSVDNEGYLLLPQLGRVMGKQGAIQIQADDFEVDSEGRIYDNAGTLIDQLNIVDFNDYDALTKEGEGLFAGEGAEQSNALLQWKSLERSNVDPMEEMTAMMQAQRSMQSASQMLKMYDQMMSRVVNELGRL